MPEGREIHRVKAAIFYVESVQEVQLIHAEEMYWKQGRGCMFWKNASVLFLRISRSVIS